MISIENISIAFMEKILFDNLSWRIPKCSRIGLVGNNGTGKTTLFRAIIGLVQPDKGNITLPKNQQIGYLPQDLVELNSDTELIPYLKEKSGIAKLEHSLKICEEHLTSLPPESSKYRTTLNNYEKITNLFEIWGGYTFSTQAHKVLKGLGFREKDFTRQCTEFSGGWKMRIILASILLSSPDILLLDEPTNHLDMATKELFQQALLKYSGTILIVSHDRFFLDNLISRVIEICDGQIYDYPGNYSYFIEKRAQLLAESKDYASSIKKAEKLKPRAKTLDKLKKRKEAKQRNRIYRQKKDFQDKLKLVEEKIKVLEENKANTESQLCDPNVLKDSKKVQNLMINLKKYNQEIETLTKTHEHLILKIKELY